MPETSSVAQKTTQITIVEVPPDKQDEALSLMQERAAFMATQPGFVAIHLYRSVDGDRIVNFVEWQNRETLQAAHRSPEFRKEWNEFDDLTEAIEPDLYEPVSK